MDGNTHASLRVARDQTCESCEALVAADRDRAGVGNEARSGIQEHYRHWSK